MMIPFSLQCEKCGEFMYRGKKFNSRKEDVHGEDYLGIRKYRFYIKCVRARVCRSFCRLCVFLLARESRCLAARRPGRPLAARALLPVMGPTATKRPTNARRLRAPGAAARAGASLAQMRSRSRPTPRRATSDAPRPIPTVTSYSRTGRRTRVLSPPLPCRSRRVAPF
jgi:hypothetical protein